MFVIYHIEEGSIQDINIDVVVPTKRLVEIWISENPGNYIVVPVDYFFGDRRW